MKKLISHILIFTILFCFPINIFADEATDLSGTCGPSLTYSFNQSTGTLTISGTGEMYNWNPNASREYVSRVPWTSLKPNIRSVIIEEGVTSIGRYAFKDCPNLTSLIIPDSLTSLGALDFYPTNLAQVIVGNNNQHYSSIDGVIFNKEKTKIVLYPSGKTASTYSIPEGVISVDIQFYAKALTSITIPSSVISIEPNAFGCHNLSKIIVDSDNQHYSSVNGVLLNKDKTTVVAYPKGIKGAYTIPDKVTSIGKDAFWGCGRLTSITIPNSVTSIDVEAFCNCDSLTEIIIPDSVTSISESAFEYCDNLKKVILSNNLTSISDLLFFGCENLSDITIPFGLTSIGDMSFGYCESLVNITIPNSVTSIGEGAFECCSNMTDISIPDSVISVGKETFEHCNNLKEVILPNNLNSIGERTFSCCKNLSTINIPSSLASIGKDAFWGCDSLTEVIIPDSVTSIGEGAFSGCDNLNMVVLSKSITIIEDNTFEGCDSLTSITIPDGVTYICAFAFNYCSNLTSVNIPSSVTNIEAHAFANCSNLTNITIPENVGHIGHRAFANCSNLENVTVSGNIMFDGGSFFDGCTNLKEVYYTGTNMNVVYKLKDNLPDTVTLHYDKENTISVKINGAFIGFLQPPVMISDRVMVPMRKIFEVLGYKVEWDSDTQTVNASSDDLGYCILSSDSLNGIYDMPIKASGAVTLQIGNPEIVYSVGYDSGTYLCDVPPQLVSGTTMVPLRAIAECAGCTVDWNDETKTVIITSV